MYVCMFIPSPSAAFYNIAIKHRAPFMRSSAPSTRCRGAWYETRMQYLRYVNRVITHKTGTLAYFDGCLVGVINIIARFDYVSLVIEYKAIE